MTILPYDGVPYDGSPIIGGGQTWTSDRIDLGALSALRPQPQPQRYTRTGLLAIEPHAFLELFITPASRGLQRQGDVAILDVVGPIEQLQSLCFDSYEDIRTRMALACASDAKAIVMRLISPGGDVLGCFETAQALQTMCAAAGKPLYAYCEKATSAAYALACAAQHISCSSVGLVGNIGVISRREDVTAANAARGLRVDFITSGSRKAFGNPEFPVTDAELAASQAIVDQTAAVFFDFVARNRSALSVEQIKGFGAGIFVGDAAVTNGLADATESFESLIARAARGDRMSMASPYEKARAALEEAAKGTDANAAAAKRALAAMAVPGDEEDEEKKEGDKAADTKPEGDKAAETKPEGDKAEDPKKDEDQARAAILAASAGTKAHEIALQALAEVHKMKAEQAAIALKAERAQLIASRPDFSAQLKSVLETSDIATVRKMVETLPKAGPVQHGTESVSGTRGATQGDAAPTTNLDLDAQMGIVGDELGVIVRGNQQIFGLRPKSAAAKAGAK